MKRWWRAVPVVLLAAATTAAPHAAEGATGGPPVTVTTVVSNLDVPWDLTFLPDGSMLYTERARMRIHLRTPGPTGVDTVIADSPSGMWTSGETGLMGIEVAADFDTTRAFITCNGYKSGSTQDVRVVRWKLNTAHTHADQARVLVKGLPSTSGRHAGCSLEKGSHNSLYIGTGDAATGTNPQNLHSGGGKVLRVDATTGKGLADNPFHTSKNYFAQRIWTYGHRNVQGLARRSDGKTWSIEQGSTVDDEVNLLQKGGNYGWNPVPRHSGDSSYNENPADSPMTDYSLPGTQLPAKWNSGDHTFATSGGTFLRGANWGSFNGALAVAALKDNSLRLFTFNAAGKLTRAVRPAELDHHFGRLRAAVMGPDGSLYVTTADADGMDQILKITPN